MADELPIQTALQTSAFDPEGRVDPYPRLKAMQERCPVFRDAILGTWFMTRYADVKAIANDRTLWRHPSRAEEGSFSRSLLEPSPDPEGGRRSGSILFLDDPDHARIRQPLMKAFYARVAKMKTGIESVISEVFERLGRPSRFDLMSEVAIPIPVLAIARILGVEEGRLREFREWSEGVILGLNAMRSAEETARMEAAREAIYAYFMSLMQARRQEPRDDLITDLVRLQAEGADLNDDEVAINLISLLVGGNLTTSDLIGNGVRLLVTHPEELAKLKADPSLAAGAVEEVLRYDSPVEPASQPASSSGSVVSGDSKEGAATICASAASAASAGPPSSVAERRFNEASGRFSATASAGRDSTALTRGGAPDRVCHATNRLPTAASSAPGSTPWSRSMAVSRERHSSAGMIHRSLAHSSSSEPVRGA